MPESLRNSPATVKAPSSRAPPRGPTWEAFGSGAVTTGVRAAAASRSSPEILGLPVMRISGCPPAEVVAFLLTLVI